MSQHLSSINKITFCRSFSQVTEFSIRMTKMTGRCIYPNGPVSSFWVSDLYHLSISIIRGTNNGKPALISSLDMFPSLIAAQLLFQQMLKLFLSFCPYLIHFPASRFVFFSNITVFSLSVKQDDKIITTLILN